MIRMISNNTSDYVATDLIHHLWCQHDEKYGHLFMTNGINEPHNSNRPCLFEHRKKENLEEFNQFDIQSNRNIAYNNIISHHQNIERMTSFNETLSPSVNTTIAQIRNLNKII